MSSRTSQAETAFVLGLLISLVSIGGTLGYQVFMYLKTGVWSEMSVITVMVMFGSKWASYPQSWIGLYNVFDWLHAGFVIPLFIMPAVTIDFIDA